MITWIVVRAAGVAAYLMLWASVAWGLAGTTSALGRRMSKASAVLVHQFLSTAAFVLLGVHIGGLMLDRFEPFGVLDVLVPLRAGYRPGAVALGIGAMYLVTIVLASSWARKRLSTKAWRRMHLLAVPAFALSLAHGILGGADTARPWMWWTYVATGGIVLFLLLVRATNARPTRALPKARAVGSRPPAAAYNVTEGT